MSGRAQYSDPAQAAYPEYFPIADGVASLVRDHAVIGTAEQHTATMSSPRA
jgi:hypothetical protein